MPFTWIAGITLAGCVSVAAACLPAEAQEFQRILDEVITHKPVMGLAEFEKTIQDQAAKTGLPASLTGILFSELRQRHDGRILPPQEQALALLDILYSNGVPYETSEQFIARMRSAVPRAVDLDFLKLVRTAEVEAMSSADLTHQGGRMPKPVNQPLPHYTEYARRFHIEGIILLKGIILEDGSVVNLRCIRNLGWGLDEAAILQVQDQWKFEPAMLNGRHLPVEANIEVTFRLY